MTFPKDAKGTKTRERRNRTHRARAAERQEKAKVRQRDRRCRVPGCPTATNGLTVAHLRHKSMGGNPAQDRSTADQMIFLCHAHHQGPRGLDGMYPLTIVPLTAAGTDGPCDFLEYGSVTLKTETAAPARGDR